MYREEMEAASIAIPVTDRIVSRATIPLDDEVVTMDNMRERVAARKGMQCAIKRTNTRDPLVDFACVDPLARARSGRRGVTNVWLCDLCYRIRLVRRACHARYVKMPGSWTGNVSLISLGWIYTQVTETTEGFTQPRVNIFFPSHNEAIVKRGFCTQVYGI